MIPIGERSKRPLGVDGNLSGELRDEMGLRGFKGWKWKQFRIRNADEVSHYFHSRTNIGIALGERSGGLVDVDLDWPEAASIADAVFPGNMPVFGRKTHPRSHRLATCADAQTISNYTLTESEAAVLGIHDDDKAVIVELRGNNHYTVFPPSRHAGTGEVIEQSPGATSAPDMSWAELDRLCGLCAFLAVVLRKYPRVSGDRDNVCLALTGALLSTGQSVEATDSLVRRVAELAGDEEYPSRGTKARATKQTMDRGEKWWGLPTVCERLGIEQLEETLRKWIGGGQGAKVKDDPPTNRDVARDMLTSRSARLVEFNGVTYTHENGVYRALPEKVLRREVYDHVEASGGVPGQRWVSAVVDGISSLVAEDHLKLSMPCWLDGRDGPDPTDLLVCSNGLLHMPTGELTPHTDDLLTLNGLGYAHDPDAPVPVRWLAFLEDVWPDDSEAIEALQLMFGYVLTLDTSQQKVFKFVGPKRSGKGTIARVLVALVGEFNAVTPSIGDLGTTFGRQSLIGKQLAIISDVRLGPRTDTAPVAETLLKISGEDRMTIPRKYLPDWEGTLRARFLILANEALKIPDPSGALVGRYIIFKQTQSFYGREDPELTHKLLAEMPGILNWAIQGYRKLRERGRLLQPTSGEELRDQIERSAAPVLSFVRDRCELAPEASVGKDELYTEFTAWAAREGITWTWTKGDFTANLETVTEHRVRVAKLGNRGSRTPGYKGIRLLGDGLEGQDELAF